MKNKTLLILLLILANISFGQKKWSLEDCILYGKEHNIQVKQQLLNVKSAEYDILSSKLNMLPSITSSVSHNYFWGRRVDMVTNEFSDEQIMSDNFGVQSYLNLYSGLQNQNMLKLNKLKSQSILYGFEEMIDNISIQIANQYVAVLSAIENLEISQNQFEYTKKQRDRLEKMVKAGSIAKGELLNIEVQVATEELRYIENQNQLRNAYLYLTQLINLPPNEPFEIQRPTINILEDINDYDVERVYNKAYNQLPEVKRVLLGVDIANKNISIARGRLHPTLGLSAGISSAYSQANKIVTDYDYFSVPIGITASGEQVMTERQIPINYETKDFSDQFSDNLNKNISLNIRIPIFENWTARTNIAKSKISKENAIYTVELEKQNLRKEIQTAHSNYIASQSRYVAAKVKVESANTAFIYAEKRFENGIINSVDYNNIKKELINAESQLINSKYQYVFTKMILDFYMGEPLRIKD